MPVFQEDTIAQPGHAGASRSPQPLLSRWASCFSQKMPRRPRELLTLGFNICIGGIIILAFGSGVLLLTNDVFWPNFPLLAHALVSAAPLLFIGLAGLGFQLVMHPKLLDLFKGLLVSMAFLLWGIDQLLPPGWLATTMGDVVIVLYVIDLGWMMLDRLKQQSQPRGAPSVVKSQEELVGNERET